MKIMIHFVIQNHFFRSIGIQYDEHDNLFTNINHKVFVLDKNNYHFENFNYFCRCRFKNRLRNFQPENDQKIKNKPGCPKIVVLIRKKSVCAFK